MDGWKWEQHQQPSGLLCLLTICISAECVNCLRTFVCTLLRSRETWAISERCTVQFPPTWNRWGRVERSKRQNSWISNRITTFVYDDFHLPMMLFSAGQKRRFFRNYTKEFSWLKRNIRLIFFRRSSLQKIEYEVSKQVLDLTENLEKFVKVCLHCK